MSKGFTPLIGLAVVVALALAAVFGALSIANPALAQSNGGPAAVEELKVEATGDGTATLMWKAATGYEDAHYQVRWYEKSDGCCGSVGWVSEANASLSVTPDTGAATTAVVSNLNNGAPYVFQVRTNKDAVGDASNVEGTPNKPPTESDGNYSLAINIVNAPGATQTPVGEAPLTWDWTAAGTSVAIAKWEYKVGADGDWMTLTVSGSDGAYTGTVSGLAIGTHAITIRPVAASGAAGITTSGNAVITRGIVAPTLKASSSTPAAAARYTIEYKAGSAVAGGSGQIKLEMADFGVPASISTDHIIIRVLHDPDDSLADNDNTNDVGDYDQPSHPQGIETDDEEIVLTIGDTDPDEASGGKGVQGIATGDKVTIFIEADAGVTLPTEGKMYSWKVDDAASGEIEVKRKVSLSEDDGGRNTPVTATAKGFRNDTSIHFWLDSNKNGQPDSTEFTLCSAVVGKNDVGTCDFLVSVPPFQGGMNYVNAVDGRNKKAWESAPGAISDGEGSTREDHQFELTSSIEATPAGGTPGESMLVELFDIPSTAGSTITKVELARVAICDSAGGTYPDGTAIPACNLPGINQGTASFRQVIPDWAPGGVQDLRVTVGTGDDKDEPAMTVNISPPIIRATPSTVVANQKVSLVGSGFNARSYICHPLHENAVISIGSADIDCGRVNGGDVVNVDSGGNWSASVDLPLDESTVDEGSYKVRARDSMGRTGQVEITIPARTLNITPGIGRVGTVAVVSGENWPSKNDEGDSLNIEIVYESAHGKTTVSASPDASGKFEAQLRIPTTAGIPSTNTVKASYTFGPNSTIRSTAVTHDVPEGIITLSETSGGPGSTVTVSGEGFKSFVPVSSVMLGSIEITPAPKPNTDANGMMSFDITIPGLDVGIQTLEVKVGQTTAGVGFTVIESGIAPGDIKPVAEAIEPVGANLVSVWHFNNDTKVWAFYSPALEEGNTLTHMITGETYLIQIMSDQEVILNRDTRNLTCVGENCWNQVVW